MQPQIQKDADIPSFTEFLRDNPDWIDDLHKNRQSKLAAMAADDPDAWERIIHEEEQALREIAGQ